jgi:hypothetical protein
MISDISETTCHLCIVTRISKTLVLNIILMSCTCPMPLTVALGSVYCSEYEHPYVIKPFVNIFEGWDIIVTSVFLGTQSSPFYTQIKFWGGNLTLGKSKKKFHRHNLTMQPTENPMTHVVPPHPISWAHPPPRSQTNSYQCK